MAIRQMFYTSCVNTATGTAGFQIKAASPSLTLEQRQALQHILGYRIPRDLDRDAIDTHPVALRYQYIDTENCYLVCTQSSGPDEVGRPGNFFAHCVVAPADEFMVTAPVEYWRHSFWLRADPASRTELAEQTALARQPSLDFDCIWPFLAVSNRRDWFAALLGAVVHFERERRPIILLDTSDETANWIACLTFALPAKLRVLLSFATYHHDPYQSPFIVTGTSADGQFRFSQDEYVSHFVLNVPSARISNGTPSAYADVVAPWMDAEHYESELLSFFGFCDARMGLGVAAWGERLEEMAELYLALHQPHRLRDSGLLVSILEPVMTSLENLSQLEEEQREDLLRLLAASSARIETESDGATLNLYARALRLALRIEGEFGSVLLQEVERLVRMASVAPQTLVAGVAAALLSLDARAYASLPLSARVIESGAAALTECDAERLREAWSAITPVIRRVEAAIPVWIKALGTITLTFLATPRAEGEPVAGGSRASLLTTVARSVLHARERDMLVKLAAQARGAGATLLLLELYLALLQEVAPAERNAFRNSVCSVNTAFPLGRLYAAELGIEMRGAPVQELRVIVEKKMAHWKPIGTAGDEFLANAIMEVLASSTDAIQAAIVGQMLESERIRARLPRAAMTQLANTYFRDLTPDVLEPQRLALALLFAADESLPATLRTLLMEAVAMTNGEMNDKAREAIARRLAGLTTEKYAVEAEKLIRRFFQHDVSIDNHLRLLQTVYVERHQQVFWPLYWDSFREAAASERGPKEAIRVLDFWFDRSLQTFADRPYMGPQFFLQLPDVLAGIAQRSQYKPFLTDLAGTRHKWYGAVEPFLESRGGLLGMFTRTRK